MKVRIEAQSQAEFDEKRSALIKALGGSQFEVSLRPKSHTRYDRERPTTEPRLPYYKAQAEILEFHDQSFAQMITEMKKEIAEVFEENDHE